MDAPPLPHILLVALPAPGHLIPFTRFAYQLAAAGAQVTCLTTGYVFQHLQHQGHQNYTQTSSPNVRVRFGELLESEEVHEVTIRNVLAEWGQALSDHDMAAALERRFLQLQPRPCCIVGDMFQGWVQDAANKLHTPRHTLFTMAATDIAFVLAVPELMARGELPFSAAGAVAMKREHILLPGMAPIPVEDAWEAFADSNHLHHQLFVRSLSRLSESSSIIVNTFEELEAETFRALRTNFVLANIKVPEILPVLLSDIPRMLQQGFNTMITEEGRVSEVEKWLNTQVPASVIYLSFGSLMTLPEKQIGTLTLALEATGYPFVWVYRPPGIPQVSNQTTSNSSTQCDDCFLPGFQDRVGGRAVFINGWAPQPQILTHRAIGAFLTHCGWNSILESVCAGVPMLAWPLAADQKFNARFITNTAQVGLRIHRNADETVDQNHIEKVLKQMMEGEEGNAARSNALKFQRLAQKNIADDGASRLNLEKFVQQCCTSASSCHDSCAC